MTLNYITYQMFEYDIFDNSYMMMNLPQGQTLLA